MLGLPNISSLAALTPNLNVRPLHTKPYLSFKSSYTIKVTHSPNALDFRTFGRKLIADNRLKKESISINWPVTASDK